MDLAEQEIAATWTFSDVSWLSRTVLRSILVVAGEMARKALCRAPQMMAPVQ
jgi:hypothetical protein